MMKILVAEDERATRARIVACLRECGHQIVEAGNGKEAWDLIQGNDISIIISDWSMPEMDGDTLVRRIRAHPGASYIYVILLTSRSEKEDIVAGIDAGADDFMTKPFDNEELRARIRAGERVIRLELALAEKNRGLLEANEQITAAHQLMKNELLAAARIQQSYLPSKIPKSASAEFGWIYEPCDDLGGDTLNIIPFNDHQFGIYVVDVAGHGVSAALLSVHLSRVLTRVDEHDAILSRSRESGTILTPPSEVAAQLNADFKMDPSSHQFFTFLYGILDLGDNTFRYTSAGHPGPLLVSENEAIVSPTTPPAIGFLPSATFQEQTLSLKQGDRLFLYSDGIFEIDDDGGHEWGETGLAKVAQSSTSLPLFGNLQAILNAAKAWQNHSPLKDDVSLIGIAIGNGNKS